ncbi:MAG: prepilin-type N-terminal cleavage/methylation domain-containing protein [Desulfotomaculum sp.]|nr:prepilin-type N-terminal cleavage/methylation domain-containing protein [Desulfotomaculum sp.]
MIVLDSTGEQGFSLIELLIALSIMGIIITAVMSLMLQGHLTWTQDCKEIELQENLQIAMDKISREARTCTELVFKDQEMGFQPQQDSEYLRFREGYRVASYYVDNENELTREFSGVGLPVSSYIKELKLEYFNQHGSKIPAGAPASDVALVKIVLTAGMKGTKDISLVTTVAVRTFGN